MEDIFSFVLDDETFEKVEQGTKTVQLIVNDSKHKIYQVGNIISFVKEKKEDEIEQKKIDATIENLLYFGNAMEAFETIGKEKCGFKQNFALEKISDLFLSGESVEEIEKHGVVALVFKIMNKE